MAKRKSPTGKLPASGGNNSNGGMAGGLKLLTSVLVLVGEAIRVWGAW